MSEERWTIPASWDWATAGDIARIVGGGTPSSKVEGNFAENGIPWITPADLTGYRGSHISRGRRDLSEQGFVGSGAQLIPAGSVLFSSRAPIGYCVIASNEVSTNQGFKTLVLNGDIDPGYIRHYLLSAKEYAESKASGTTFMELSGARVAELAIPIAPLPEQRRIVAKVDGLTARTARARKELDRIPTLIARYKQRLLALAFSGELIGKRPNSVEHLDAGCWDIPANWQWKRFDEVAEVASNLVKPETIPDLPHIAPDNIEAGTGRLLPYRTISEDKLISAKNRFYPGQVLYSKIRPYLKKAVLIEFDGACSADMYPINPRKQLNRKFLLYWLISDDFATFSALHEGRTVLPKINQKALNATSFPLPPLEEQAEIVRRIEAAFGWLDRMAADHAAAARLLPKLDAAILAKAFQGKLVPQDPSDEPAAKLLERIKAQREAAPKVKRGRQVNLPSLKKDLQTMAQNLEQVLSEAGDWLPAQEAFQQCGIGSGASTEEIENIYAELRKLDKAGKIDAEPVNDDQGRKLYDRLRLKVA